MVYVLHLIWGGLGKPGGIQQFCVDLVNVMNSEEYCFDFAVCDEEHEEERTVIPIKSSVYHLPSINGRAGKKAYLLELKKVLQTKKYDVVHSHLAFMNISTLKVARECGVPVRISHTHVAGDNNKNMLILMLKRVLMNHYATHCFGCSQETVYYYYGSYSRKTEVLYSGIYTERFISTEKKKDNLFVIVARICPEKNPSFILDIVEQLAKRRPQLEFVWYGTGKQIEKLRTEVLERKLPLVFAGGVLGIESHIKDASYMLMPSLKEGFGMAAVEAQILGIYVFASDRVPDDVDLGRISYFPLDSPIKWADRIEKLIDSNIALNAELKRDKIVDYDINFIANKIIENYCK